MRPRPDGRVHPRASGGAPRRAFAPRQGSIPARAGEPSVTLRSRRPSRGSIPARAGEPPAGYAAGDQRSGPSPRERGSLDRPCILRATRGSIPARAGEPGAAAQLIGIAGSIPARAGEPSPAGDAQLAGRVHPRASGGAAPRPSHALVTAAGPSPRERGSRHGRSQRASSQGSIPARAGEPLLRQARSMHAGPSPRERGSLASAGDRRTDRVHPRASGGAAASSARAHPARGPSPRERGSLCSRGLRTSGAIGSIPARAGEPSARSDPHRLRSGPSPRERGSPRSRDAALAAVEGPSPRERGSPSSRHGIAMHDGSIPARAGEPAPGAWPHAGLRVHPRASGGAALPRQLSHVPAGSIPARAGEPSWTDARLSRRPGSIPARAGEPLAIKPCRIYDVKEHRVEHELTLFA